MTAKTTDDDVMQAHDRAAEHDAILLTKANVRAETRDLPPMIAQVFRVGVNLAHGSLTIDLPNGKRYLIDSGEDGPSGHIRVKNNAFFRKLFMDADIGVAEAYMAGDWDSEDVTSFLQLFALNFDAYQAFLNRHRLFNLVRRIRHFFNRNTRFGSRRNISAHYDLGNAFFAAWLDPSMTYSSALFEGRRTDLTQAQTAKYGAIASDLGLAPDHTVLEIGCGWGGFAEFAAREVGCKVVGLTISREQFDYAQKRLFEAGLADKTDLRLRDYRDEDGSYDRIVSIEMIEAVGEKFWPTYFKTLSDRLVDGGRAGIQAITIHDDLFEDYRRAPDFIQRYIFPGGMLPARDILADLGRRFGIPLVQERAFGLDYAATLAAWRERFEAAWPAIEPMGFDERFHKLWNYYLHYCEAGFRGGSIDVRQMFFAKPA